MVIKKCNIELSRFLFLPDWKKWYELFFLKGCLIMEHTLHHIVLNINILLFLHFLIGIPYCVTDKMTNLWLVKGQSSTDSLDELNFAQSPFKSILSET